MEQQQYLDIREIFGDQFMLYVLNLDDVSQLDVTLAEFDSNHIIVLNTLQQMRQVNEGSTGTPEGFALAARINVDRYIAEANLE
jgi:hypothetical protein